jgi:predicted transcriptional regulator
MSNISQNISELDFIEIEEKIVEKTIDDNINELYIQRRITKDKEGKDILEIIDQIPSLPRTSIQINVMKRILKILINRRFGISHTELAMLLNINRKNLSKYLKILIERNWISRSQGEGNYFIAPFFLLKSQYYENIWNLKTNVGTELGFSAFLESDFDNYKFDSSIYPISKQMVYFANRIGAIFILLSLFIIDPRNDLSKDYKLDNKEKDLLTMKWISDMLSKLAPKWIEEFRWMIRRPLAAYIRDLVEDAEGKSMSFEKYKQIESLIEPPDKGQIFTLSSELINILSIAFKEVYPSMYKIFENAKDLTQKDIEENEKISNYNRYRFIRSSICEHDFFNLSDLEWADQGEDRKHCRRCHLTF